MDEYATTEQMEERLLRERLRALSVIGGVQPQQPSPPQLDWQHNKHNMSMWQFREQRLRNFGTGKYKALYENRLPKSSELNAGHAHDDIKGG